METWQMAGAIIMIVAIFIVAIYFEKKASK